MSYNSSSEDEQTQDAAKTAEQDAAATESNDRTLPSCNLSTGTNGTKEEWPALHYYYRNDYFINYQSAHGEL
jgi:hypothetical protein